jgi:hypothetical protein
MGTDRVQSLLHASKLDLAALDVVSLLSGSPCPCSGLDATAVPCYAAPSYLVIVISGLTHDIFRLCAGSCRMPYEALCVLLCTVSSLHETPSSFYRLPL